MFPFYDLFGGSNDGYDQYQQRKRRNQQYDDDSESDNNYYGRYNQFDPYAYQAALQMEQNRQKRLQQEQYRRMLEENERRKQQAAYQAYMNEQYRQQREYEKQMQQAALQKQYQLEQQRKKKQQEEAEKLKQKEYMQMQQQLYKQKQHKQQQSLFDQFFNTKMQDQENSQQIDESQIHSEEQQVQQMEEEPVQQKTLQNNIPKPDKQNINSSKATKDPYRDKCDMSKLKQSQQQQTLIGQDPNHNIEFQTYDKQAVQQPVLHKMKSMDYESAQHMTQDVYNSYITIQDCKDGEIPDVEAYGGTKSILIISYKLADDENKQIQLTYKLPANYDRTDIQATRTDKNVFLITVPHQTTDDKLIINFDNCGYKTQMVQTEVKESETEKTNSSVLDN